MPNKDVCQYESLISQQYGRAFVRKDWGTGTVTPSGHPEPAWVVLPAKQDFIDIFPGLSVFSDHG